MKKTMLALAAFLAVGAVHAEDTLKKIKDSGTITMGVRESSGVLSYTLGGSKYVGYHVARQPLRTSRRLLAARLPSSTSRSRRKTAFR